VNIACDFGGCSPGSKYVVAVAYRRLDETRPPPKPARVKSGAQVAATVRDLIVRGELVPGDRLPPEDELMTRLGLARTTVREGLRILETQGLLRIRRGRRGGGEVTRPQIGHLAQSIATVLQMDGVDYRDLQDAAEVLEPVLAGRLARTATPEDLEALRAVCERAAAASRVADPVAFGAAAAEFHQEVASRAGNHTLAVLAELLSELRAGFYQWASEQSVDRAAYDRAVRSYRKLIRLIAQGDEARAEEHWRRQISYVRRNTAPGGDGRSAAG
jgi:GntR family transcriptional repressor for pyruvate dehydrogenase complex